MSTAYTANIIEFHSMFYYYILFIRSSSVQCLLHAHIWLLLYTVRHTEWIPVYWFEFKSIKFCRVTFSANLGIIESWIICSRNTLIKLKIITIKWRTGHSRRSCLFVVDIVFGRIWHCSLSSGNHSHLFPSRKTNDLIFAIDSPYSAIVNIWPRCWGDVPLAVTVQWHIYYIYIQAYRHMNITSTIYNGFS